MLLVRAVWLVVAVSPLSPKQTMVAPMHGRTGGGLTSAPNLAQCLLSFTSGTHLPEHQAQPSIISPVRQFVSISKGSCCLTRMTVQGASMATLMGTVATKRCICKPWVAAPITIMLTLLPCA